MSNTASYIGKEPTYGVFITQAETGDGSTVAFSLDATATTTQSLLVSVGGVLQQPSSAYNINSAGTTLTFTEAPGSGHVIWILFLGQTLVIPQASSANTTMITGESALGTIPAAGDYFLLYDADAAAMKKVAYSNLETGDIAGVTAGTGISGGGTSGTVTVSIDTAVTADLTTAQTMTNKVLTSPVVTTPQINDTSADHQYVFAVSELTADRTVTLPLLTGADEFTFNAHAQTLTNKTLTSPDINTPDIDGGAIDGAIIGAATPAAATVTTFTSTGIDDNSDALAMTITAAENIGIGTATAADKLTVSGDGAISGSLGIGKTGPTALLDILGGTGSDVGINVKSSGAAGNSARLTSNAGDDGQLALLQSTGTGIVLLVGDASTENYIKATLNMYDNVFTRPIIKDYGETVYAGGSTSTAVTLAETNGNVQTWTMTGNCTFTMPSGSGLQAGTSLTLILTQDGTGSRTGTFTAVKWKDATAPVLTTTATTGIDIITFYTFNGGASPVWYGFLAGSAMG